VVAVGDGEWGDLELPGWITKLLLAKFISNGIVEPLLLSAREATSRLGARRPASGGSVVVESKDSTAFPSFFGDPFRKI
jgi:hypothetical protein